MANFDREGCIDSDILGDLDEDGYEDDACYIIEYAFALYRVVQRRIVLTVHDYDKDLVIDAVAVETK